MEIPNDVWIIIIKYTYIKNFVNKKRINISLISKRFYYLIQSINDREICAKIEMNGEFKSSEDVQVYGYYLMPVYLYKMLKQFIEDFNSDTFEYFYNEISYFEDTIGDTFMIEKLCKQNAVDCVRNNLIMIKSYCCLFQLWGAILQTFKKTFNFLQGLVDISDGWNSEYYGNYYYITMILWIIYSDYGH